MNDYPKVFDEKMVGKYPALARAGGGYVWDEVLEYRVWCHPEDGAEDLEEGSEYYHAFVNYEDAKKFSESNKGTEEPLALILQEEFIDEPEFGKYVHVKETRITEWAVEYLIRPRRTKDTIPNFLSPNAPSNRLDILRGLAKNVDDEGLKEAYKDANKHAWTKQELEAYDYAAMREQDERGKLVHAENRGRKEREIEMARAMKMDNETIEKIIKYTGLTEDEIHNI